MRKTKDQIGNNPAEVASCQVKIYDNPWKREPV